MKPDWSKNEKCQRNCLACGKFAEWSLNCLYLLLMGLFGYDDASFKGWVGILGFEVFEMIFVWRHSRNWSKKVINSFIKGHHFSAIPKIPNLCYLFRLV